MRLLRPLRERDFALLMAGTLVSLLGDGVYIVTAVFAALELAGGAAGVGLLSLVGLSNALGLVAFLLVGGVLADRRDKRLLLIGADAVRLVALAGTAALSFSGALQPWHLVALSFVYGAGEGLGAPAMTTIIVELVPSAALVPATALAGSLQPLAQRMLGPALGGVAVATLGIGGALAADAVSFLVSIGCLLTMRSRPPSHEISTEPLRRQLRVAAVFVRAHTWLWATLIVAAVALLAFLGPSEVLLPYRVKHELGHGAGTYGLILGVMGLGDLAGTLALGHVGIPRRDITFMYWCWGLSTLTLVGFGLARSVWLLAAVALVNGILDGFGNVVWSTLVQVRVPAELRGRVSSLDWLVSVGLTPVSFALTAPVAAAFGAPATLVVAGAVGALVFFAMLYGVRGLREEDGRLRVATEGLNAAASPDPR